MLLDGPRDLRARRRAHGTCGRLVRVNGVRRDVQVWDVIRPGGHHRGDLGDAGSVRGVGAGIENDSRRSRDDQAFARDARLQVDDDRVIDLVWSDELVMPVEDDTYGPAGLPRQRRDVRFEVELALAAKTAAEVRNDDANVALRHL